MVDINFGGFPGQKYQFSKQSQATNSTRGHGTVTLKTQHKAFHQVLCPNVMQVTNGATMIVHQNRNEVNSDPLLANIKKIINDLSNWVHSEFKSFPTFERFRTSDWENLAVVLNDKIKKTFIKVKRNRFGRIIQGTTGMTTLRSIPDVIIIDDKPHETHFEEYISGATLKRMVNKAFGIYTKGFREAKLDAVCICLGWDGYFGFQEGIRPGEIEPSW